MMNIRARRLQGLAILAGLVAAWFMVASPAHADDCAAPAKAARPGEITLRCVVIKERAPRPLAAVEVGRVTTQKAIPLRAFSPFDRIEGATRRAPF